MSKRKKGSPWSNIKKKPGPKRIQFEFKEERKASLAESDKGSWFKQEYEEDEPKPKKVSASSSKLKAQSAEKSQDVEPTDSFIEISESSDSSEEESEESEVPEENFAILNTIDLNSKLQEVVVCRFCQKEGVQLVQESRTGCASEWALRCKDPKCSSYEHSSYSKFYSTPKNNRFFDINRAMVLAFRLIGRGYSAAVKFTSILNLPNPVRRGPWSEHTKAISEVAMELLQEELKNAALELKKYKLAKDDNEAITDELAKETVVDAGVSVDGSWSSRGWSARDGVVAVVSIDTGKVLDVEYLSNGCSECVKAEERRKDGKMAKIDYLKWYIDHEPKCHFNHDGSAPAMEAEGACRIYGRSLQKHKVRYIPYVGDGDSKSYAEVTAMQPYGPSVYIPKEDCIAHVTKRMGTALRRLVTTYKGKKLDDGKGIGGQGRLTKVRIDTLQIFYGKVIRDNKGDAAAMSKATHAILKHYSSTAKNPKHEDCPQGSDSWCSYNRDKALKESTHVPIKDPLPPAVVKVIQPVFDRLGNKAFLVGSEKCLTQNTNESLHHVIWGMAPKQQYTSQHEAKLAVALGVIIFNNGIKATMEKLMARLTLEVKPEMVSTWEEIDGHRIATSDYKASSPVKKRRKRRRKNKNKKDDAFKHQEGVMYKSQSF